MLKKIVELLKACQQFLKGKKVYLLSTVRICYGLVEFAEAYDFEILLTSVWQAGVIAAARAALSKLKIQQ